MENNVLMQPSADITPPTRQRGLSWLNISLIALACIGVAVIVVLVLSKKTTQDNLPPVSENGKYLEYRKLISDRAFEITGNGSISGSEFVQKMNPAISQTKDTDYYRSIDIYATFLAARHNLSEIALGQFEYYINQPDLTDKERCELYEYRRVIEGGYETNLYSPEENEENRNKYCAVALAEYSQAESEDTFAYAERLYYEGFITESMRLFESIDPENITDDTQYDYYKYILSYYYATAEYEKYHNAQLGYTKYVTENSSEEEVYEE